METIISYTIIQAKGIRDLLKQLEAATTLSQKKSIRAKLRNKMDFHIEHFTSSKDGFNVEKFEQLIAEGKVKIN